MLYYEIYDNQKEDWVVFIHGIGGSTKTWKRQIEDFSKCYNLVLLDLHGHGKSKLDGKITVKSTNEEIKEVLDYLNIKKANFVGLSLGTVVIAQFAIKYPEYVKAIVLGGAVLKVEGFYKFGMWVANKIKHILPKNITYKLFAGIVIPAKWHKKSREIFISESKKLSRETFLSWMDYASVSINPTPILEKLKKLGIRIFFVSGNKDVCFIDGVKKIAKDIKNARLRIIKDCGHICTIEKATEFNRLAIAFLNNIQENNCRKQIFVKA